METVFNHNPTPEEIEELGFLSPLQCIYHGVEFPEPLTPEVYQAYASTSGALFDLGLLFDLRGENTTRDRYWSAVPELVQQYQLGFDYNPISS